MYWGSQKTAGIFSKLKKLMWVLFLDYVSTNKVTPKQASESNDTTKTTTPRGETTICILPGRILLLS